MLQDTLQSEKIFLQTCTGYMTVYEASPRASKLNTTLRI